MGGMPPWLKNKKKGSKPKPEQGDADQDEARAKDTESDEEPVPQKGKKPPFGKKPEQEEGEEQSSGPSIGKKFKFKTTIHTHEGENGGFGGNPQNAPHERAGAMMGKMNGKPHPSVHQFHDTVTKLVDANFPSDADKANMAGMIQTRWLGNHG